VSFMVLRRSKKHPKLPPPYANATLFGAFHRGAYT